jgi:hypothetical protein
MRLPFNTKYTRQALTIAHKPAIVIRNRANRLSDIVYGA